MTTLLLGATPASAQPSTADDYAYAFAASGIVDIEPVSLSESADGGLVSDQLAEIVHIPQAVRFDFGVLTSEAEASRSETAVTEVNVMGILRADLIRTWCEGGDAGLQVVNGTILGQAIPDTAVPSEELDLSPLVKLSLNQQVRNPDDSLTVTGLELTLLPGAETNPDEELTEEEQAALPALGALFGRDLSSGANTVGDVAGQVGLPGTDDLPTADDLPVPDGPSSTDTSPGDSFSETTQTIIIGEASCQGGGSVDGDSASADGDGEGSDDGEGSGDSEGSGGDDTGSGDDNAVQSDTAPAPKPSVVEAALPVTG